ncbi:hypothetical protein ACFE04_012406 [Oxalis oulophora]
MTVTVQRSKLSFCFQGRLRKPLENLRSPSVTELLLSNEEIIYSKADDNGDEDKDLHYYENKCSFEVQTAPISHGVLPGIIRQLVIELKVCILSKAFDHPVDYGAQSHTQRVSFSTYAMVGFVPRTHSVGESAEWNGAGAHTNYR